MENISKERAAVNWFVLIKLNVAGLTSATRAARTVHTGKRVVKKSDICLNGEGFGGTIVGLPLA